MNTHERAAARLDDYAGDALPPHEAREVAAHLEGCARCRAELAGIRALLALAAGLPRGIAPERDLWAGIAARIGPGDSGRTPGDGEGEEDDDPRVIPLFRRAARIPRWLMNAAAAVLVAVASSAVTLAWMARQEKVETAAATGTAAPRQPGTAARLVAYAPAEAEYRRAVGDLEMILATRRDRLAPATIATLERNLRIIDEAIRQSREALAADPANAELATMLSHAYDAKVETLRRVVAL